MRQETDLTRDILKSPKAQEIIDYVSPVYSSAYVGLWLFQAIGLVLDDFRQYVDDFEKQTAIPSATWSIPYWEKQYGLASDANLTPEQRRARILSRAMVRSPFNPHKVCELISSAIDGVQVDIEENTGRNKFRVLIREPVENLQAAVEIIEYTKPAHLIYELVIAYQTQAETALKTAAAVNARQQYSVEVIQ